MRSPAWIRNAALATCLLTIGPAWSAARPPIALIIQFHDAYSPTALDSMKTEIDRIASRAGLRFVYRLRSELSEADTPSDIVLVNFRGRCLMRTLPELIDERGSLAFTHTVEGEVLPFSEVACDRVRVSVRRAMWGKHWKNPDEVLGRALGRIVAHELYHILVRTDRHTASGVTRAGLSAEQLVAEELLLDDSSANELKFSDQNSKH